MRSWWCVAGVMVATAHVAHTQPAATPSALDACIERRHAMVVAAEKITDVRARGRAFAAIIDCHATGGGAVDVIDPLAPPPPEPRFEPAFGVAAVLGARATWIQYHVRSSSSFGPYASLDGSWHFSRHFSIEAFAGYAGFDDGSYLGSYDVRHRFVDFGARLRVHFGPASFAFGGGVEVDDSMPFADVPGDTNPLALFELSARYDVASIGRTRIVVDGGFSYGATQRSDPNDLSIDADAISARLAIGARM